MSAKTGRRDPVKAIIELLCQDNVWLYDSFVWVHAIPVPTLQSVDLHADLLCSFAAYKRLNFLSGCPATSCAILAGDSLVYCLVYCFA